ncbi:DUF4333 domain-containing protein [Streptomyces sp. M10(2022)]
MSKEEVAEQASAALGKKVGREPDDVTCEDDLKAEVGETVRCELTVDGEKQGVTATATSVDDDNVEMDFKVDDAPAPMTPQSRSPPRPPSPPMRRAPVPVAGPRRWTRPRSPARARPPWRRRRAGSPTPSPVPRTFRPG